MRVINLRGRPININANKYRIEWDGRSPSKFQFAVKQFFKPYWEKMLVLEEMTIPGSRMRVDFVNVTKRLAVEANGVQHSEFSPFFHKYRSSYYQSLCRDQKKLDWLEKNNFKVIELIEADVPLLSPDYIKEKFGVFII